jgi:hypothetical protein
VSTDVSAKARKEIELRKTFRLRMNVHYFIVESILLPPNAILDYQIPLGEGSEQRSALSVTTTGRK